MLSDKRNLKGEMMIIEGLKWKHKIRERCYRQTLVGAEDVVIMEIGVVGNNDLISYNK